MKITIINGSPKGGKSTSELMIGHLVSRMADHEVEIYNISKSTLSEEQLEDVTNSDVLVFAFPLYIDSMPAHLLSFLVDLEKQTFPRQDSMVYCVVNNGFFEGKQNCIATQQMKHWCKAVNLTWGQAVGIGAGEMLPFIKDIPLGYGPNKNVGYAINQLSLNILSKSTGDDILISPNWPRPLWKIQSSSSVWYPWAKANGLKKKELYMKF